MASPRRGTIQRGTTSAAKAQGQGSQRDRRTAQEMLEDDARDREDMARTRKTAGEAAAVMGYKKGGRVKKGK